MSDKSILVIDDSATIRKLVDTHLSPAGYRVVLAANAEEGIQSALETRPDLILLDHQLPGTTGYDVCCRLVESPELQQIPVVVSSTLRKKAYAEYLELDNVVDMLPKPYSEELLLTTVANALETAAMVVSSQSQGTAVPETIDQVGETDLAGSFAGFSLRELIDFLNNGRKSGVLEVEAERVRLWIHLDGGRIQGVSATGIGEEEVAAIGHRLPESLTNLAPVLKLTISGRSCAEVDGFVQLLDRKVLDPRLMTKLLRYQAAMLLRLAFTRRLSAFRFQHGGTAGSLPRNLPLNHSLLALLIEGAVHGEPLSPAPPADALYARRAIRGQNLDRAGLSAQHMKIMNLLSQPRSADELAEQLGWQPEEVRRVLEGFLLAELVELRAHSGERRLVIYEPESSHAQAARAALQRGLDGYAAKLVQDAMALQVMLKRAQPDALLFAADDQEACRAIREAFAEAAGGADSVKRIALMAEADGAGDHERLRETLGFLPDRVLSRPLSTEKLTDVLNDLIDTSSSGAATAPAPAAAAPPTSVDAPLTTGAESR